jgi:hypothetical protein
MNGSVVFDQSAFLARYPEFSGVSNATLSACFGEATLYLSNGPSSPVQDLCRRAVLLNMLTAHIAYLGGSLSADGQALPVGRVSSATEGAVTAQLEYMVPGSHSWYTQTAYGAAFWQATLSLRSFRYVTGPDRPDRGWL